MALYLSRDSRKQVEDGGLMKIMNGLISDVRKYRNACKHTRNGFLLDKKQSVNIT